LHFYKTITKALAERTEFHTFKPKEEINCKIVLQICIAQPIQKKLKPKMKN
jgi:hypothetical protein